MDTRQNEWEKLEYFNPSLKIPELYRFRNNIGSNALTERQKALRTCAFKRFREEMVAHLFCYGIGKLFKKTIYISPYEDSDYDAVSMWEEEEVRRYAPIQIKEVVPHSLNPLTDLNTEIQKLKKYPVSHDTIVVIHLNRTIHPDVADMKIPALNISQLWILGNSLNDEKKWYIHGDLLKTPRYFEFEHPGCPSFRLH